MSTHTFRNKDGTTDLVVRDVIPVPVDTNKITGTHPIRRFHLNSEGKPFYPDNFYAKTGQMVGGGPTITNDKEGYGFFMHGLEVLDAGGKQVLKMISSDIDLGK